MMLYRNKMEVGASRPRAMLLYTASDEKTDGRTDGDDYISQIKLDHTDLCPAPAVSIKPTSCLHDRIIHDVAD